MFSCVKNHFCLLVLYCSVFCYCNSFYFFYFQQVLFATFDPPETNDGVGHYCVVALNLKERRFEFLARWINLAALKQTGFLGGWLKISSVHGKKVAKVLISRLILLHLMAFRWNMCSSQYSQMGMFLEAALPHIPQLLFLYLCETNVFCCFLQAWLWILYVSILADLGWCSNCWVWGGAHWLHQKGHALQLAHIDKVFAWLIVTFNICR